MVSRSTIVASVVVLALLAGCAGLVGDDDSAEEPGTFDYPDGFSAEGVVDGDRAVEGYERAVRARGNYTGSYRYDVETGEGESVAEVEYRVDFESERAYQRFAAQADGSEATRELYQESDRRYYRSTVDGEVVGLDAERRPFRPEELTAVEAIRALLTDASGYEASLAERNGTAVAVYETTDLGNTTHLVGVDDPDEVTDFRGRFAVDSEGLIRTAEYELTYVADGDERRLAMAFDLSAPGETTVERPAWADEA